MKKQVLLVEDDLSLGKTLQERLSQDFAVTWSQSKKSALENIHSRSFDLAILDVGLPDGSGFDIAEILQHSQKTAILFLTAQGDAESRLHGYEVGAQEYIPKPFHLKELLLRIQHVLDSHAPAKVLALPTCEIDFSELKIQTNDGKIHYPAVKDLRVLELLIARAPSAVSRDQILDEIWGPEKEINHRTIDNTIVRLKKSIGDNQDLFIRSVRGIGYHWIYQAQEEKSEEKS